MPPVAQATESEVGRIEEDTTGGSPGIVAVVEKINGGSPAWGELPLQWMAPQDPTLTLFSLDDATESIEQESLNEGISALLEALN